MPTQIAVGAPLDQIASRLRVADDHKSAAGATGARAFGREIRAKAQGAYIKAGSSWFTSAASRETHRAAGRQLVYAGLRASLGSIVGEEDAAELVAATARAAYHLSLPEPGQAGTAAHELHVRRGIRYAQHVRAYKAEGLTFEQAHRMIESHGFEGASPSRQALDEAAELAKGTPARPRGIATPAPRAGEIAESDFETPPARLPSRPTRPMPDSRPTPSASPPPARWELSATPSSVAVTTPSRKVPVNRAQRLNALAERAKITPELASALLDAATAKVPDYLQTVDGWERIEKAARMLKVNPAVGVINALAFCADHSGDDFQRITGLQQAAIRKPLRQSPPR